MRWDRNRNEYHGTDGMEEATERRRVWKMCGQSFRKGILSTAAVVEVCGVG